MISRLTARPAVALAMAPGLVRQGIRDRRRRGLSMLEYALMALVVIAVFGVMIAFLPKFFQTQLDSFNTEIGNEKLKSTR